MNIQGYDSYTNTWVGPVHKQKGIDGPLCDDKSRNGYLGWRVTERSMDCPKCLKIDGGNKVEKSWGVDVFINGERILSIDHASLSGVNDIEKYSDTIRHAAECLLAFIGSRRIYVTEHK